MSKRILVVEDQEDNMRIMIDALSSAGYEVIKAVTGDEVVAMAESHVPDLIPHGRSVARAGWLPGHAPD